MEDPGQAGEGHNQDVVITVGLPLAAGSKPGAPVSRNKGSSQVQAFVLEGSCGRQGVLQKDLPQQFSLLSSHTLIPIHP